MAFHISFQNDKKLKIGRVIKNLRGKELKKTPCIYENISIIGSFKDIKQLEDGAVKQPSERVYTTILITYDQMREPLARRIIDIHVRENKELLFINIESRQVIVNSFIEIIKKCRKSGPNTSYL